MTGIELSPWGRLRNCVLNNEQVRSVDRRAIETFGMHSLVLMENAALSCVDWLKRRFAHAPPPATVILCGSGNNGGDGLAIARHLRTLAWPCSLFVLGPIEKLSIDASANAQILLAGDSNEICWWCESVQQQLANSIADAELIIDAMLGTGAHGDPRPPFNDWIHQANQGKAVRVAIDIPTGIDGDTGKTGEPRFQADATLTFVAKKPAMTQRNADRLFGEVEVLPIGIPSALMEAILREGAGESPS